MAWVVGVFRRLGDVLSVTNGSGWAEMWTSVSPCRVYRMSTGYRRPGVAAQVGFESTTSKRFIKT
jgi:hypothetical protein